MTRRHRRMTSERGSALIETALTLPLLLLVSVSIFEFGRAFETWQIMTNAAREGARIAVLPNKPAGAVEARVKEYLQIGALSNVDSASINVQNNVPIAMGVGTASGSQVTVSYPFQFMVLQPVANLVVSGSSLGAPITLTTSAIMRNESQF
jgi:Flp pilus assembly protein TadG